MKLCNCGKAWDDCMGFCNLKTIDPLDFYDVDHPCTECEHDPFECTICTKTDDSKYKRAWEALPERLGGKIKVSTLVIILKIMDEVLRDES